MEEWRIIESFPNYEVSNIGRVRRRLPSHGATVGKYIKPFVKSGYAFLRCSQNGKAHSCYVHRLVTHAFLGPCPHGHQVDHINFNRLDNRIENLRYLTPQQNSAHSVSFGRTYCGERHHSSKLCSTDISVIRFLLAKGYPILRIANFFSINRVVIQGIARGKLWKSVPHDSSFGS